MMNDHGLPGGVNPLDFLHKLATQRSLSRPEFQQLGEQGLPHNKIFMWQCSFHNIIAQGTGRSKKEAKVAAARAVRDQLNFEALPPAPTYQSVMEKKKRKFDDNSGGGPGDAKQARKYDYSRHFQCYSGGLQQAPMMSLPYGYLPDRQFSGNGMMNEDFNFDPYSCDPYMMMDQESAAFGEGQPPAGGNDNMSFGKGFMSRLSKLDRYVIKRHTEIYPTEDHLSAVLKLVTNVEVAMKKASQDWNDAEENKTKIEGLVRVGDLAKGLLLSPDRSVSLVLLCISPPTKAMLQQIHMSVRSKIKEIDSTHDTLLLEKEAAFAITKPLGDSETDVMFCYITFTSTALRKNSKEENGEEPDKDAKEDASETKNNEGEEKSETLPVDKCLQALAELRHSRWFAARAASLPSCVECIRIMKDLSRRDPIWASLSDWSVELLVERALYSAWRPLNPAASLMRVMEVLALGLLLEESDTGLIDPCEREELAISPFTNLTKQEKEDITKSAQYYLRLMHFRQIYRVLGMKMEEPEDGKEEEKDQDAVTEEEENQQG